MSNDDNDIPIRPAPAPLDPEQEFYSIAFGDLRKGPLFTRALAELPGLSNIHEAANYHMVEPLHGMEAIRELSRINLGLVRQDCAALVPEEQRKLFLQRFETLRFYWKHGSGVFDLIKDAESLTSTTRLVEHLHSPAVMIHSDPDETNNSAKFYFTYVPDPKRPGRMKKVRFVFTSKSEYDFSGDPGFIFFRYNFGRTPAPNTRFGEDGGVQFVFDPKLDPRLHEFGWVTLRDVMQPYTGRAFREGLFAITSDDGRNQRLTSYEGVKTSQLPASATGNRPLNGAEIGILGRNIWESEQDLSHRDRQYYVHEFRGEGVRRRERREHVMEGVFFGPDIEPGIAHSAMRAFAEIPALWNQAMAPDLPLEGFEPFMRSRLHNFFHIEAKFPWKLPLPGLAEMPVRDARDQYGDPVEHLFGNTGARVYFLPKEPDTADGLTWDEDLSMGSDDMTSAGSMDFPRDGRLEATTGWDSDAALDAQL